MDEVERKRLYWVWSDMKGRCSNPNHKAYANYGARGISYCEEWEAFDAFFSDMGERPSGGMLERIDNNGGYCAANCKWASRKEQNSNRRCCIYTHVDGERVTLKEACRRMNQPYRPIVKRLRRGWPISAALTTPMGGRLSNIIPN